MIRFDLQPFGGRGSGSGRSGRNTEAESVSASAQRAIGGFWRGLAAADPGIHNVDRMTEYETALFRRENKMASQERLDATYGVGRQIDVPGGHVYTTVRGAATNGTDKYAQASSVSVKEARVLNVASTRVQYSTNNAGLHMGQNDSWGRGLIAQVEYTTSGGKKRIGYVRVR